MRKLHLIIFAYLFRFAKIKCGSLCEMLYPIRNGSSLNSLFWNSSLKSDWTLDENRPIGRVYLPYNITFQSLFATNLNGIPESS